MRPTVPLHLVLVFACLAGCQLPHREGPVPQSLVTSRQLSRQGLRAIERGRWEQADSLLSKAVLQCPEDPEAHRHFAEVLWHKGLQQQAIEELREAATLSCDDASLQTRLAEMHLALGQLGEADQAIGRSLRIDPHLPRTWLVRGRLARAQGRPAEALAHFYQVLHYAPDNPETLLELADLYQKADQPDRALAILQGLGSTYSPGEEPQQVLFAMGLAYSALGRYPDAADTLASAATREPAGADLLYRLAENQLLCGRTAQAEASIRQALAIDPSHAAGRELLAQIGIAQQPAVAPLR